MWAPKGLEVQVRRSPRVLDAAGRCVPCKTPSLCLPPSQGPVSLRHYLCGAERTDLRAFMKLVFPLSFFYGSLVLSPLRTARHTPE